MPDIQETVPGPGKAGPEGSAPQGETQRAQGPAQQPVPRMPHERDESVHSQAADEPSQKRMGDLGHADLERGVTDTDKGPVIDDLYQKTRETSADPARKFRR